MNRLLLLFFTFFISALAEAQTISVEIAQTKAASYFRLKGTTPAEPTLAYIGKAQAADEICFYIFNNPDGGFVIIGGNEIAKELIGYSNEGCFDSDTIPTELQDMLNTYKEQIVEGVMTHTMKYEYNQDVYYYLSYDQYDGYFAHYATDASKCKPVE